MLILRVKNNLSMC